ncbi:MAG: hypothetical protein CMO30_00250 [Tistrella sp.]|uniref:hypothetical protein n=1 Tax=Tistrella TaxID=171436 RepID=UPI000C4C4FA3|nr:hypothetical protein [Tistrella sp.]MAD35379.1 hypothetical protein [Tistrella sp.]MBA73714.1 hypothetical protein [Tistrella sp.]|tara:strand:- start:6413 stop:6772 length:360 start_codon:yes stop_codon:yes gene_type:complete
MSESKRDGARKRATLDLSGFAPTPAKPAAADVAAAIGREAGFTSRAASVSTPTPTPTPTPAPRRDARMTIVLPAGLHDWLREQAFHRGTSMRGVIMAALKEAGAPVDDDDLHDRRQTRD